MVAKPAGPLSLLPVSRRLLEEDYQRLLQFAIAGGGEFLQEPLEDDSASIQQAAVKTLPSSRQEERGRPAIRTGPLPDPAISDEPFHQPHGGGMG
jgi:hypothetical protein